MASAQHEQQISWSLCWHYARVEMRGSVARFRVFLLALLLGVASIGAVGSIADAMRAGIADNARTLLGGDIELSSLHTAPDEMLLERLEQSAERSDVVQMRAMLRTTDGVRKLVELKAVDQNWPLVGSAALASGRDVQTALAGLTAIGDAALLRSLNLAVGDTARLGNTEIVISDILESEPDNTISFVSFGPRLLVSSETLAASGLKTPGSFITYRSRFTLADAKDAEVRASALRAELADSHIRVRSRDSAAPGFERFIERAELFLILVGLTALLIGGLGVSGAVRAWLASRMAVIATFKCLGAPSDMIFRIYMMQVMAMASMGIICGLVLAALAPAVASSFFASYVNVPLMISVYPLPLLFAGGFGLLTTFVFALWPLAKTRHIKAAHLFRTSLVLPGGQIPFFALFGVGLGSIGLVILAMLATGNVMLSVYFMVGTAGSVLLLSGLGELVLRLMRRLPAPSYVPARLALSAITRANSPLRSVIIAFGLGLSVLVAVTLSQVNLTAQLGARADAEAPDWFFIDIQPQQISPFEDMVSRTDPEAEFEKTPMLRGRVTAINGISTQTMDPPPGSEWIVRGDRALTWQALPPEETEIVRGQWWEADYRGRPLVSVTEEMFTDFGLSLGDTVTLNILGREFTAEIVNTRKVAWESFRINFVFIASPGLLDKAPHSWIATTRSENEALAGRIEQKASDSFTNISAVSVKDAVRTATKVLDLLGGAIQLTAIVTLISGLAVLAGTVASTEAQRLSDSIVLKVLGATRRDILIAWIFEYGLLGLLTALVSSVIGSVASYGLISVLIGAEFTLDLSVVFSTAFAGAAGTIALGLAGALRSLAKKPAPYLREAV